MSVSPDELKRAGNALFGAEWLRPLAEFLAEQPRTLQKWASGDKEPGPELRIELAALLLDRGLTMIARGSEMIELAGVLDPKASAALAPKVERA